MRGRRRTLAIYSGLLVAAAVGGWMLRGNGRVQRPIRPSGGEVEVGEDRPKAAPPSVQPGDRSAGSALLSSSGEARLSLVDILTRRPPVGTRWALERAGSAGEEREVAAEGWRLPLGEWRLECLNASLKTLAPGPVLLSPGENVVWVGGPARLQVEVVDPEGNPISEATLRLVFTDVEHLNALGNRGSWEEDDVVARATTDSAGRAVLSSTVSKPGTLYISAKGFDNASRPLLGPASMQVTLERPSSLPGDVAAIGAFSGLPLEGIRIWSSTGPVTASSGPDGIMYFASGVHPNETLTAQGDGILPTSFQIGELDSSRVLVHEGARLSIGVLDTDGRTATDVTVMTAIDADDYEGASGPALLPALARPAAGGGFEAFVPLGRRVTVLASSISESAEASLVPDSMDEAITVTLAAEPTLRVHLPHGSDDRPSVVTNVQYRNRLERRIVEHAENSARILEILHPEHVRRIVVESAGYAAVELKPHQGAPGDRSSGDVEPDWLPAHRVRFIVKNDHGEPVVGAFMRFSWKVTYACEHPELHGFKPTGHPAWVQRVTSQLGGTTDSEGRLTLWLPEGEYTVFVGPDPRSNTPNHGVAYKLTYTAEVYSDAQQEWIVPAMRLSTVHAYDPTGAPIQGIQVTVPDMVSGSSSQCAGNRWQGWIPSETEELFVRATSGGEQSRVSIGETGVEPIELITTVGGKGSAIQLVGDTSGLEGRQLQARARASWGPDAPTLWKAKLEIEDPDWIPFDIPSDKEVVVELSPVQGSGSTWTFQPSRQAWQPAAVLRYVVSREPDDR